MSMPMLTTRSIRIAGAARRAPLHFIGALCLLDGGDRFAGQRVQDEQRLPTLATHEQML